MSIVLVWIRRYRSIPTELSGTFQSSNSKIYLTIMLGGNRFQLSPGVAIFIGSKLASFHRFIFTAWSLAVIIVIPRKSRGGLQTYLLFSTIFPRPIDNTKFDENSQNKQLSF
jgi:hypothetical protein